MQPFHSPDDGALPLSHALILKAALRTIGYIEENGPIGLTPGKALKRYFVAWAAEAFDWPGYTVEYLYVFNKVLNEHDFPPLMILHEVLLSAKLARHFKGTLRLTDLARKLQSEPARLWMLLTTHLLFVVDHSPYTRSDEPLFGNWDIFLNVINIEAQVAVTEEQLCSVLYGGEEAEIRHRDFRLTANLYVHVLRPLCWAGLLNEHRTGTGSSRQIFYTKTPLWTAALRLETDRHLRPITRH